MAEIVLADAPRWWTRWVSRHQVPQIRPRRPRHRRISAPPLVCLDAVSAHLLPPPHRFSLLIRPPDPVANSIPSVPAVDIAPMTQTNPKLRRYHSLTIAAVHNAKGNFNFGLFSKTVRTPTSVPPHQLRLPLASGGDRTSPRLCSFHVASKARAKLACQLLALSQPRHHGRGSVG